MIYCTVKVTIFRNNSSRIFGTACGLLEIPGSPPVVHLVWNKLRITGM